MAKHRTIDVDFVQKKYEYDYEHNCLRNRRTGKLLQPRPSYGYAQVCVYTKTPYAYHRIVWAVVHGEDPGNYQVDHIDNNRGNNAIDNLRLVNQSDNNRNRVNSNCGTNRNIYS